MGNWIFCRRCDPTINAGSIFSNLNQGIDNECMTCVVLCASANFISQAVADQVMGEGNWSPGDTWALFNDGDDFVRDDSRPVPVKFTTAANPNDTAENIVVIIDIGDGDFVWTRRNYDPDDPDFPYFDLTTGTIDAPVCSCGPCVSFNFTAYRTAFASDGLFEDFSVSATVDQDEDAECNETITICMRLAATATWIECDGWFLAQGDTSWAGSGEPYDGVTIPDRCRDGASLHIYTPGNDCTGLVGILTVGNQEDGAVFHWELECDRDPRDIPDETDFVNFTDTSPPSSGDLNFLTYGGTCDDDDPEDCSGPEDCPTSYCKWQWNVDTQVWDLLSSNCIDPATCGPQPGAPLDLTFPWVICTCCITIVPTCPPGTTDCTTPGCVWTWHTAGAHWLASTCPTGIGETNCTCHGMPDFDGAFDGQTVDGICCDEPAP